jgi:hypothetical protein
MSTGYQFGAGIGQWASILYRMNIRCAAITLCLILLTACSPYQLQGRVVEGKATQVLVVSPNDSRLNEEPVYEATVELTLDPSSISPKRLGQIVTDDRGNFVLDIDATGAGSFMEYDLGILVTAQKHRNVWQTIKLPSAKKRLLVIMTTGSAGPPPPKDILKESLQLKDRFMGQ